MGSTHGAGKASHKLFRVLEGLTHSRALEQQWRERGVRGMPPRVLSAQKKHSPAPAHLANEEIRPEGSTLPHVVQPAFSWFSLSPAEQEGLPFNRSPPPPSAVPGSSSPERAGITEGPQLGTFSLLGLDSGSTVYANWPHYFMYF